MSRLFPLLKIMVDQVVGFTGQDCMGGVFVFSLRFTLIGILTVGYLSIC